MFGHRLVFDDGHVYSTSQLCHKCAINNPRSSNLGNTYSHEGTRKVVETSVGWSFDLFNYNLWSSDFFKKPSNKRAFCIEMTNNENRRLLFY
jgi:hypothetical protein